MKRIAFVLNNSKAILSRVTKDKFFWAFIVLYLGLFMFWGRPFVGSDGWCYYIPMSSLVEDGSLRITHPEKFEKYTLYVTKNTEGTYYSPCSHGPSIMWMPFYLVSKLADNFIMTPEWEQTFGVTFAEGLSILVGTAFYSFVSSYLLFLILKRHFKKWISFVSVVAISFSMYYYYYSFFEPSFIHVHETFGLIVALYIYLSYKKSSRLAPFAVGFFLGLAFTNRIASMVFLIPFGFLMLKEKKYQSLIYYALGFLAMSSTTLIYNYLMYGNMFTTGFQQVGAAKALSLDNFNFLNLIFHPIRGLFPWSPLTFISLLGFPIMYFKYKLRKETFISLSSIFLLTMFYSFWFFWWAGLCVGQRFLISLMPFFAFGLAAFLNSFEFIKEKVDRIVIKTFIYSIVIVLTLFGIVTVQLFYIVPYYQFNKYPLNGNVGIPENEQYSIFDLYAFSYKEFKLWSFDGIKDFPEVFTYGGLMQKCPMYEVILRMVINRDADLSPYCSEKNIFVKNYYRDFLKVENTNE